MAQNIEIPGQELGIYAPVGGTPTLVAARRGLDLTDTVDTYDATHADNMLVSGQITAVSTSNDTVTVEGVTLKELERGQRGSIRRSTGNDGDYTWAPADVTDNGDGTFTIAVSETIDDSTADGVFVVPSPHGYREFQYGLAEWEVSLGAVLLLDGDTGSMEASHRALLDAKRHGKKVGVIIRYPNTDTGDPRETGDVIITDYTLTSGFDELGQIDITMEGASQLTRTDL